MDWGAYWMRKRVRDGAEWQPYVENEWYSETAPAVQASYKGGMVGVVGGILVQGDARLRYRNRKLDADFYRNTATDGTELDQTRVSFRNVGVNSKGRFEMRHGVGVKGGFTGPNHEEVIGELRCNNFHDGKRLVGSFGAEKQ